MIGQLILFSTILGFILGRVSSAQIYYTRYTDYQYNVDTLILGIFLNLGKFQKFSIFTIFWVFFEFWEFLEKFSIF